MHKSQNLAIISNVKSKHGGNYLFVFLKKKYPVWEIENSILFLGFVIFCSGFIRLAQLNFKSPIGTVHIVAADFNPP
jgi:hypothetical protein